MQALLVGGAAREGGALVRLEGWRDAPCVLCMWMSPKSLFLK
jgi:hypothetical protein